MRLLFGNYELTIDDKNRLLVPSEIRKAIDSETDGEAFFLVAGHNGKLWLYPEKYYESLASQLRSGLAPEDDLLAFDQLNFSLASRVEWDKQGRMVIPEKILRKQELSRDVTLIGVRDHAELWNRSDWEAYAAELESKRAEVVGKARQRHMGSMGNKGLAETKD